jgi:LmbE family N-acetylglucosaminyl deacetylase
MEDNNNPIIIRPHIVFTHGRQQRQPNHNTTTYYVYSRTTTTTTQSKYDRILWQYVVVLWLGCRCCFPSVNTICGDIMIGLSLLSSVSKHNMWSYYDLVVVIITRPHIVFTDGRQRRQPNHNTTTYCVYWRKTTTTQLSSVSKHNMWSYYDWVVVVVFRQ